MQVKKKHSVIFKRLIRTIAVLLILSVAFFCLFEYKARDLVHNLIENELEIHAMNAIDTAVAETLEEIKIDYGSLVTADYDSEGKVSSLSTNTKEINILKAQLSLQITDKIRKDSNVRVGVPSGAFTGIVLLSSIGPDIIVRLRLGGSVTTTIISDFTSAGINQTIHRVYLLVDANVSLTCPIITYETDFTTEYELCQTVIIGNTPQTYADIN